MSERWWLYMLECRGGGIYTGIAIDVDRRYAEHAAGKGAKYTKINPPVRILHREVHLDRRAAAKAEYAMKLLTANQKWEYLRDYVTGDTILARGGYRS
jgi:putative endonuclease